MKDNPSIADQGVFTLGEIERMADGMDNNDPMRHTVRKMKQAAEQAVIEGLRLAQEITDITRQMRSVSPTDVKRSEMKVALR